jgi:tetratricopeptide (TPR) repeat protein
VNAGLAKIRPLDERQAAEHGRALDALRAGERDTAHRIATALLAAAPNAPDAWQLMAWCHADAAHHDEADRCMQEALALAPGQAVLHANRAALLRRAGQLAEAAASWQAVVEIVPGDVQAWRSLGGVLIELGDTEAALSAARRACSLRPDDAANWRLLGLGLCEARRWERATSVFLRALQIDAEDAPTWLHLATAMRFMGRSARALECLERARQLGLASRELSHGFVGTLVDLGRVDEARQQAERLVHAHTDWPEAHRTLAMLRWEHDEPGDTDPLRGFKAAAAARPDDVPMQWELARLLIEARRAEEALSLLQPMLAREGHPMVHVQLANAYEVLGEAEAAQRQFVAALAGFGSAAPVDVLNAWCRHLLRHGRWEQAESVAAEALRKSPLDQEAWAYRGTAWRLLEDPREAWLCDTERLVGFMPIDVPPGHPDLPSFLGRLREAVEPLHTARRQPVHQSVRGGSQTSGRLFGRPDPVIEAAAQALKDAVQRWAAQLPDDPTHPFLARRHGTPAFAGSWSVKLTRSGRHANHMHSEGWLSSAFYIALPPTVAAGAVGDAGALQFGSPPDELGLNLPPRRVIRPREGWLALFPSYLWHGTLPFDDPQPRITAAFDLRMQAAEPGQG